HVDRTRTRLLHVARTGNARVLLITSAAPGEGKTMTACHLAASLARAGRRTLLVDGDLRRPVVHGVFDIPASPGLAELLRGEANVDQALQPTSLPTFSILPAGRWDPLAARALACDRFRDLLGVLKTRFEFVIVDSAPVLPLVDSLLLGQHCDGAIFSLLHGVSRAPAVQSAGECLSQLGIRVFGAVLNGATIPHSSPYYAAAES